LALKTDALARFQKRLNTASFERGSLKKSPKYFQTLKTLQRPVLRRGHRNRSGLTTKTKTRYVDAINAGTAPTTVAYEGGNNG
jgi:hypothetical protein